MDHFVHDENLRHYRRLLDCTSDPVERARILELLAEEEAKMVAAKPPESAPDRRHS